MSWDQHGPGEPGPQNGPTTAASALGSPFTGAPPADVARDVVAALLLGISLTLPWDYLHHQGSTRLEVMVITLVSIASLAIGYLARAGAFGPSFPIARAATFRLLANVPYLVMVAVFLLVDAAAGSGWEAGGVGAGVAVGLAGALLAAQPREAELAAGARPMMDRAWHVGPVVLAALYALTALTSMLIFVIGDTLVYVDGRDVAIEVLALLLGLAMVGIPLVGLVRRNAAWRLVLIVVTASPLALYLVGKDGAVPAPMFESIHALSPGLIYWPAIAALAAAPSARRAMRGPVAPWAAAAVHLLTVAIVVAGIDLLISILGLIDSQQTVRHLILILLALVYLAAAVVGRVLPIRTRHSARRAALAVAAGLLVVGAIAMVVSAGDAYQWVMPAGMFLALVVPVALAVLVGVQLSQEARGMTWPQDPPPQPAQQYAAPPAPPMSDDVRLAMDPATPAATLADLAARAPETWVHLARNPSTYPDLLTWLGERDRPEVNQALAERAE